MFNLKVFKSKIILKNYLITTIMVYIHTYILIDIIHIFVFMVSQVWISNTSKTQYKAHNR